MLIFMDSMNTKALYRKVRALNLKQKVKEKAQGLDLLRFQINEIDTAALKSGEKETLIEEKAILSNLSRLKELAETTYLILYGSEGSCRERLSSIIPKVREMPFIDQSVSDTLKMLESVLPLIGDAAIFREDVKINMTSNLKGSIVLKKGLN